MAVQVRGDYDAEQPRRLVGRKEQDSAQARCLLAIALGLEGCPAGNRKEAARLGGMDRQALRDWVHRFNAAKPLWAHQPQALRAQTQTVCR